MATNGFGIRVDLHQGDLMRLRAKLSGMRPVITEELVARAKVMGANGVALLNYNAPKGSGDDWARGDPPLSQSHRFQYRNPFYAYLYTDAPHAEFIAFGFTPHMPPAHAWTGSGTGYMQRKAVLANATPRNPIDWFSPVAAKLETLNDAARDKLAAKVAAKFGS